MYACGLVGILCTTTALACTDSTAVSNIYIFSPGVGAAIRGSILSEVTEDAHSLPPVFSRLFDDVCGPATLPFTSSHQNLWQDRLCQTDAVVDVLKYRTLVIF